MAFRKGDVVLVPIPFTDFCTKKVRPAVVLSSEAYHDNDAFLQCFCFANCR
jgi:mRNA-degrading endonuclease toxin of MazEF toxin-antitoxin module